MAVDAIQRLDVQRHARVHRQRLEELAHQLDVEAADLRRRERRPKHEEWSAGDVDRDAGQRLVHRQQAVGPAGDAALLAERLAQGLAERDSDVLDRMVIVDVQVALRANVHVDQRMARQLIQHMIEETDAGRDFRRARTVEVDFDLDRSLVGLARNGALTHGWLSNANAQSLGAKHSKDSADWPPAARKVDERLFVYWKIGASRSRTSSTTSGGAFSSLRGGGRRNRARGAGRNVRFPMSSGHFPKG